MSDAPHVLIVDDDAALLRALARTCRRAGAQTVTAQHGRQALEVLPTLPAGTLRLILCDVRMPVLDGHGFLSELAGQGPLPCPVVFLTGHSDYAAETLIGLGAKAVLSKPMPSRELQRLIESYLAA